MAVPASAGELRVTGFFDNTIHLDQNSGRTDGDVTRNGDNAFMLRERGNFTFNFIASDDLRGVLALELDAMYGTPAVDNAGSGCPDGEGTHQFAECGLDEGIDNNLIEVKWMYVDFRVPQIPIGNRWQLGGFSHVATPLHPGMLYYRDAGGIASKFTFTDQVALQIDYIQIDEDTYRFRGSAKVGEDYITFGRLELKPLPGLDLHLLSVFGHLHRPFGNQAFAGASGTVSSFGGFRDDGNNTTTEDRYYLGFDSRYRLGNLSIEPTFIYLLGTRKSCTPLTTVDLGTGTTPCTSAAAGQEIDYGGFQTMLILNYTWSKWLFTGAFGYTSGNKATDDLNNRGVPGTTREDVGFRPLGLDGSHPFGLWNGFWGRGGMGVDSTGTSFYAPGGRRVSLGEVGEVAVFGAIMTAGAVDYKATDKLVLRGAVGAYWTAEKTACPAVFRRTRTTAQDPRGFDCLGGTAAQQTVGRLMDYTGDSRYMATAVDVGTRYSIMPGLLWSTNFSYGFLGDALKISTRNVQDTWLLANQVLYAF
jgi:hypothetical protein